MTPDRPNPEIAILRTQRDALATVVALVWELSAFGRAALAGVRA